MLLEPESLAFWYDLFLVLICFLGFTGSYPWQITVTFSVLCGIYVYTRFCIQSWNCFQRCSKSTFSLDILETRCSNNCKLSATNHQLALLYNEIFLFACSRTGGFILCRFNHDNVIVTYVVLVLPMYSGLVQESK